MERYMVILIQWFLVNIHCIRGNVMNRVCPVSATLEEARACCHSEGKYLPGPLTRTENANVFKILTIQNKTSTWLDVYRVEFQNWTWIDHTVEGSLEGNGCGLYNSTSQSLIAEQCGSIKHGVVCGVKECRSCYQLGSLSTACHHVGDTCYLFLCEDTNWFAASSLCRSIGYTLAVIKNLLLTNTLKKKYMCDTFWVGVRKEDWIYHNGKISLGESGSSIWDDTYISKTGNCSHFYIKNDGYEWQRARCEEGRTYICLTGRNGSTLETSLALSSLYTKSPETTKEIDPGTRPEVMASALAGILALIGSIVFLAVVLLRYRKRRHSETAKKFEIELEVCDKPTEKSPLTTTECVPEIEQHDDQPCEISPLAATECDTGPDRAVHVVDCDQETGVLTLDNVQLSSILSNPAFNDPECPLVVLSIAGPFRTGKSFLMNYILRYLLAKEKNEEDEWMKDEEAPLEGFQWECGSPVTTLGIWIWSKPIRIKLADSSEVCILLIDTQGLYELDNRARQSVTMTTLSCLISSMQIYNVTTEVSEEDMERLNVLGRAAQILMDGDSIKEGASSKPIQRLIFLVRDWSVNNAPNQHGLEGGLKYLNRRLRGHNISEKQRHLREELHEKVGDIHSFLMPHPGHRAAESVKGYNGNLAGLTQQFKKGLNDLCKYLFGVTSICKMHPGDKQLYGKDLCRRIMLYVAAFNADRCAIPVSTVEELLCETNKLSYQRAIKSYCESLHELMRKRDSVINIGNEAIRRMKLAALSLYDSSAISNSKNVTVYRDNLESDMEKLTPSTTVHPEGHRVLEAVSYYLREMTLMRGKRTQEENFETLHEECKRKACDLLNDPVLKTRLRDTIEGYMKNSNLS